MPSINPKNRNTQVMFPVPTLNGHGAKWDRMIGEVRAPGDHQSVITTYDRRLEVLRCVYQVGPPVDGNAVLAPFFGLICSAFGDSQGQPTWGAETRNKAYARFKDKVLGVSDGNDHQTALGVLAGERREAYGMIANRALGLLQAVRALRRGDFRRFLRYLSVSPKRKHRNKTYAVLNEASGLWLEYWFGWSPTFAELYHYADFLSREIPLGRFSGSASSLRKETDTFGPIYHEASAKYRARTGATVHFVNPDLFLLQNLGLANPISVFNELVPFSFVLEWVVKYQAVIDSFTDFLGLELRDPWSSFHLEKVVRMGQWVEPMFGRHTQIRTSGKAYGSFRKTGIIKPVVVVARPLDIFKPKARAASAVSLLLQALVGLQK